MTTMKLAYRLPKGALKRLAEAADTHSSTVGQIIARTQGVSAAKAIELADACARLGINITREQWVFAEENELKFKINDWFVRLQAEKKSARIATTG